MLVGKSVVSKVDQLAAGWAVCWVDKKVVL